MGDFIRLNLNKCIELLILLIIIFIGRSIFMKYASNKYKKFKWIFRVIIFLVLLNFVVLILNQTTVNNIPRNEIDRSYLIKSQDSYKLNVLKNSKKDSN